MLLISIGENGTIFLEIQIDFHLYFYFSAHFLTDTFFKIIKFKGTWIGIFIIFLGDACSKL